MKQIKYLNEIEEVLRFVFYESYMNEEDWKEFIQMLFDITGFNYQDLSNQIEEGVANGYSPAQQISVIKQIFEQIKLGNKYKLIG